MLNILLVEDDEYFRKAVESILLDEKWKVTLAPDGKSAREMIKTMKPFDVIVSDIQMPFLTGVELLEWIKKNKPTPVILMTGFALIMETKRAHDLGADDFLAKPFEAEELIDVVKRVCHAKLSQEEGARPKVTSAAMEFCKVAIDEFVASPKLHFDVYVKLSETRLVKIAKRGDSIPLDRVQNFKGKGLNYLYIRKEDFQQLVEFNLSLAKVVVNAEKVSTEKKASFLRYTGEVIMEKAFISGVDKEAYQNASDFLMISMNVLADEPTTLDILNSLNVHSDFLYAHSLCVSICSHLIAVQLGWTSVSNLFKLSLAALFHDIGKKEIDREIINKPRPLLTFSERQIIETHPLRGREILLRLPSLPSEVVAVAYEHHEDNLGQGYPRGLSKHQIHPFAQIVRVANLFAGFYLKGPAHPGMAAEAAMVHMARHYLDSMNPEAYRAIRTVLGINGKYSAAL